MSEKLDFEEAAVYFDFDTTGDDVAKYNKAVCDSLVHWVEMFLWMEDCDCGHKCPFIYEDWREARQYIVMKEQIGTIPDSNHCPLCEEYIENDCEGCPLVGCGIGSLWDLAVCAATKYEWLVNARNMIKKLFELRFYDEKECK